MNKRKNNKNMWTKFGSPANHSATNLLIEPPASTTTKLLRGNRSITGCDNNFYSATAAIIPAAAKTASVHGATSAQTTQQIYGTSNFIASRSSPATGQMTGHSAAALSFAAMNQMQLQNKWYSA